MNKLPILLLIFLSLNGYPQDRNDSILNLIESATDTTKIRMLTELCWENRYTRPAEALEYGLKALALVNQIENHELEATINNYLGIIQRNFGDHAKALEYFFNAKRIAEEHENETDLAYSFNNIGDIFNMESNYRQALEFELRALKIFETLGDSAGVSYCCHQIALVYANIYDYMNSMVYDKRAMKIRESLGNRAGVAYSLISLWQTYLKMGKSLECYECLDSSSVLFGELNDSFGLSLALHNKGLYYKSSRETENAAKYFNEALNIGLENDLPISVRNAAQELSDIYAEQSNFEGAYQMYMLFKETYDSLYQEENLIRITQMVMQNEYEQRELVQLAKIERQKQFRNYLILSFGLVLILVIVIFNRYFIKRKANINLHIKNKEIESQKDHLVLLNHELEKQKSELNITLKDLTQAQTQLVQSEKMASLGLLTAGVAHELNNPLNFINSSINPLQRNMGDLFSLLNKYESLKDKKKQSREISEMKEEMDYSFMIKETMNLLRGIKEGATRS